MINALTEQLRLLKHHRFGSSSEKTSPDQLYRLMKQSLSVTWWINNPEPQTVNAHTRKRGHRKALSKELPRIEIMHDLTSEEKLCACGCEKTCIGEETSEQLEIIPAQIRGIRDIFQKYICSHCDDAGIQRAKPPLSPIPRSNVTAGLLAYIIAKFMGALSLYRQKKIFDRLGVVISRTTMARWIIQMLDLVLPLLNLAEDTLKAHEILAIDDTPLQVLKEEGKSPQSKSYMFVRQGGPPDKRVILYDYSPSKSQPVVDQLLDRFDGYLQSDDMWPMAVLQIEIPRLPP